MAMVDNNCFKIQQNERFLIDLDQKTDNSNTTLTSHEIDNLEDARRLIRDLRQKSRMQAQQIMTWRRAYKIQELLVSRLQKEKCDQLKALSSKLLLFESRLIRKQKDISNMLNVRESIISKQQRVIESLSNRLYDNGLELPHEIENFDTTLPDNECLNDSDSAVVMEDYYDNSCHNNGVSIMRSISDAIDTNLKFTANRRSNGFLRRPEVLETVYSVEEDAENCDNNDNIEVNKRRESFASSHNIDKIDSSSDDAIVVESIDNKVKTYNRVMLNHRSVTKPKDVKYKRINKAKSKSLEELRGRLKSWVENGNNANNKLLEHSHSYA